MDDELSQGFTFGAVINRITSTVDGGWRVAFDLPDSEKQAILKLAELRDRVLQVGIVPKKRGGSWPEE